HSRHSAVLGVRLSEPRRDHYASGGRVAAARHPVEGKRRAWPSSRRHPTITYSGSVPVIAVTGKGTALAVPRGTGIPSTGRIDVKRPTAVSPRGLCLSLFVPLCALLPLEAARAQETGPNAPAPESGTIAGVVTAVETGSPIPNVRVTVSGTALAATSGPDGRYTIALVPPGTYRLQARLIGEEVGQLPGLDVTAGQTAPA